VRGRALVVAALVAAFVLGVAAAGLGRQPSPADRPPSHAAPDADTQGTDGSGGTASEVERSEASARAAAIAFATASQDWLYLSDEEVDRSVRAIATPEAGPSLSQETVSELRTARDALRKSPGRVWWVVRPLASRVERFEAASARVAVWIVTILSAADVALPQAEWLRVAVDLVWADGAWRVQAVGETPGPTPMTGTKDRPWQPEPLDGALAGFERVGSEAPR
jgi:hypothetical protein